MQDINTYETEAIGNIIIVCNIIFENSIIDKKEADHAWKNGRPCIIIYSDNEYDYILPIKSSTTKKQYDNQYIELKAEDLIYRKEKEITKGKINILTIYRIPISGHNKVNKVKFTKYKKIINVLKQYHRSENIDEIIKSSNSIRGR